MITLTLSNHVQMLLRPVSSKQLSSFMRYVNSNVARKIGRYYNWPERFWGRRYQAIVVSDEEEEQLERFLYLLSHGTKEGLVWRPQDWPGVQVVDELMQGRFEVGGGIWFDETAAYEAKRRGERVRRRDFAYREALHLSPLPCWDGLSREQIRDTVRGMVEEIIRSTRADHLRKGTRPLGVKKILAQSPYEQPETTNKSPAPLFHAATKKAYQELLDGYRRFVGAYREAAKALRAGNRSAAFPPGSFPAALPWVPEPRPSPI